MIVSRATEFTVAQRAAPLRAAAVPRIPKIHTDKAFLFQGLGSKDHRGLFISDAVTPLWKYLGSTPGGAGHFWPCYIQVVASDTVTDTERALLLISLSIRLSMFQHDNRNLSRFSNSAFYLHPLVLPAHHFP